MCGLIRCNDRILVNSQPVFSIITPVFNGSAYIGRTIESVRAQSFSSWEHIIVDDGSTENIAQAVQPYLEDSRIKLMQIPHAGVSAARNVGTRRASGRWLAFLDGDDMADSNWLAGLHGIIGDSVKIAFCAIAIHGKLEPPKNINVFPSRNQVIGSIHAGSFAVLRELFLELSGYDEGLRQSENFDLVVRFVGRFVLSEKDYAHGSFVGVYYTPDPGRKYSLKRCLDRAEAAKSLFNKLRGLGVEGEVPFRHLIIAARNFEIVKKHKEAREMAQKAIQYRPFSIRGYYWLIRSIFRIPI